jgi:hypothetical protein
MILNPNINQSLYWWNGMRSYTLPLLVLSFVFLLYQLLGERLKKNIFLGSILSFVFFFANGGLSETYVVLQFSLLVFLLFLKTVREKSIKRDADFFWLLAGIIGTLISLFIILYAPGN